MCPFSGGCVAALAGGGGPFVGGAGPFAGGDGPFAGGGGGPIAFPVGGTELVGVVRLVVVPLVEEELVEEEVP